ncbi:MAG TPA: ParA family protein [Myxococcota bacterium]|nr:ParA family protein [Myxococcota bacterium]HRY92169.1 ParA family protein [Myxococcota bacterium]HSA20639.1 ParA family protein [Myxococcota bacterium]
MERISYSRGRFAEILGLTDKQLRAAERKHQLPAREAAGERYTPADLSRYRQALALRPAARPQRRQLFLNFKGGTGKTSLSSAYAYRLAEMGHRVLLVDLDSQGHASKCLGLEAERYELTLFDVLVKRTPVAEVIQRLPLTELALLPSNLRMSTVELALMPLHAREFRLRLSLDELQEPFDFVVMDAPPSFGLLNLNALLAAHDLIIPVLADFLSFHGLRLLFETIADLERDLELALQQVCVVINNFNPTTRIARQARTALEEHYKDYLLGTVVRQCTKFAQASSEGVPISAFLPGSKGAEDIDRLVAEVLPRCLPPRVEEPIA